MYEPESDADASQMIVRRQFDEPERNAYRGDYRGYTQDPSSYAPYPSHPTGASESEGPIDMSGQDESASPYAAMPDSQDESTTPYYTPAPQGYAFRPSGADG